MLKECKRKMYDFMFWVCLYSRPEAYIIMNSIEG